MKVAIDVSPLTDGNASRGVGFYTRYLVDGLQQKNDGNQYILIKSRSEKDNTQADLIHYPYFDLFFRTFPGRAKIPTVVTLHDLTPLVLPALFPKGIKATINLEIQKYKLQKVDKIITDSESSKRDIVNILHIPQEKVEVVYLACDPSLHQETDPQKLAQVKQKYNLPNNYFLRVGDINRHKNFFILFDALTRIPDLHLVLVGKALAKDAPKIQELVEIERAIESFSLQNRVHRLGFVPSEDMSALYSAARGTVHNSLYEGFGLTALESMTCGTPVIAGNTGSQPEIVESAGIQIDPEDVLQTTRALEKLKNMPEAEYKQYQEKSIKQAKKFSVQKMVDQTIMVYESILS